MKGDNYMTKKQYINEIANRTCLPYSYRKKIIKDFTQEFDLKLAKGYSEDEIIKSMGDADAIAADIYENYMNNEEISRPFTEYKSKKTIFGMPLIHVVKSKKKSYIRGFNDDRNRYMRLPTAKGFIAIGRRAKGVISIGNFSCGIIAFGNLSAGLISISNIGLGLFSLSNIALGLFMALGNLAVGTFSIANAALAYAALGNAAIGKYAIGNSANGYQSINLDIQGMSNSSISLFTPDIKAFISNTPPFIQSFFNTSITIVQNSIEKLDLLILSIVSVIIFAFIVGIFISNWIKRKTLE